MEFCEQRIIPPKQISMKTCSWGKYSNHGTFNLVQFFNFKKVKVSSDDGQ